MKPGRTDEPSGMPIRPAPSTIIRVGVLASAVLSGFTAVPAAASDPPPQTIDASNVSNSFDVQPFARDSPLPAGLIDSDACDGSGTPCGRPVVAPVRDVACDAPDGSDGSFAEPFFLRYTADYDDGFRIHPLDDSPFDLKINGWLQFRYKNFDARTTGPFVDRTGTVVRDLTDRNAHDLERGRLIFSGHTLDPRLSYFLQLDADSDGGDNVELLDYYTGWKFNDRVSVQLGRRKIPGSRLFLNSPTDTRMADRSLATEFFRPGRTTGVHLIVEAGVLGRLHGMIGNNFRSVATTGPTTDDQFTYAIDQRYTLGDFGDPMVDFVGDDTWRMRLGQTLTIAPQTDSTIGDPDDNEDFLRLADGTRPNDTGAFAPGVTVAAFDVLLYTVDVAAKYGGWSMDAEGYYRRLSNLVTTTGDELDAVDQTGYVVQGGRFLVPRRWDINVRYSIARDDFGRGESYGIGTHWYPLDNDRMRFTFDATRIVDSPVTSTGADLLVGDDGMLYRTQLAAEF